MISRESEEMLVAYHLLLEAQCSHMLKVSYSDKIVLENPLDVQQWEDGTKAPLIFHYHNTVPIEDSFNIFLNHHLKYHKIGSINNVKLQHD